MQNHQFVLSATPFAARDFYYFVLNFDLNFSWDFTFASLFHGFILYFVICLDSSAADADQLN